MRSKIEKIICLIFKHKYIYKYKRITRRKNGNNKVHYIYECYYCEKQTQETIDNL